MLPEVLGAGQVGASMSTHGHNDDPMQSIPASQLPAAIQGAPNFQVASVTLDASVKVQFFKGRLGVLAKKLTQREIADLLSSSGFGTHRHIQDAGWLE
jgi:hypothetical protein